MSKNNVQVFLKISVLFFLLIKAYIFKKSARNSESTGIWLKNYKKQSLDKFIKFYQLIFASILKKDISVFKSHFLII